MSVCADYLISHSQFLEWDPTDRDKAIWWKVRQSEICPNCGTREDEWLRNRNAYRAEVKRCRGCEVREQFAETDEAKQGRGIYIVMKRREVSDGSG